MGFVLQKDGEEQIRIKSLYSKEEKKLLQEFIDLLDSYYASPDYMLCAHNGKEFDIPFLCRRILINQLKLPFLLNIAGKKPWEIKHIDTMEQWKFGDYKNYTSLDLLTYVFDIPTPKDDIDGSMVAKVYYEDQNLERIVSYCEKDVVATIQLFRRYQGNPLISEDLIQLDEVTIAVQVNGKLRANINVSKDSNESDVISEAMSLENVKKFTSDGNIVKTIYVPNRLLNFVVQ